MVESSADDLIRDLQLGTDAAAAFDVLAAGLPCQAFARIGRSKLREIAGGEEDAFQKDPRAALYRRFLDYVTDTQPLAIIIENVLFCLCPGRMTRRLRGFRLTRPWSI